MKFQALAIVVLLFMMILAYPVLAAGTDYTEYQVNGLRVIVINARTPSYSFNYCGDNYIDLNASNNYAVIGPQKILGLNKNVNAGSINIMEVANALQGLREYTIWYNNTLHNNYVPLVIIKQDYGAIEVLVKPNVDPVEASKQIANALRSLMLSKGYTTLIVVRALSDMTPGELENAFNNISNTVMKAIFNPPQNAPQYLLKLAKLQQETMNKTNGTTYITVGIGAYGSIVVDLWGPKPTVKDLEELAKWIRDKTGECSVPLYIEYNGPNPPIVDLEASGAGARGITSTQDIRDTNNTIMSGAVLIALAFLFAAVMSIGLWKVKIK